MKNFISVSNKLLVGIITVTAAVSIAAPASADTTTAGYYDQFGNFHMYQVYTPPTSYYSGGNVYYGNSVNQYSQYNRSYYGGSSYDSEYGVRVVRPGTSVVTQTSSYDAVRVSSASNYGYSNTNTSNLSVGKSATTADNSAYTGSAVTSLFGGKKAAGKLEITNIVVTSGPLNIYNDKTEVNCDVTVSWNSGVPTAGQVVYGTVSQPKIDSFSYQATAPESNSLETSHSVKLGCLDNATYYFRIVAFSAKERVVSDEQIIFPIKIRTQIPVVGASKDSGNGASVLATLGKITTNPFVLIVLLGVIAYLIATRMSRKGGSHAAHAEPAHAEPSLLIPHH